MNTEPRYDLPMKKSTPIILTWGERLRVMLGTPLWYTLEAKAAENKGVSIQVRHWIGYGDPLNVDTGKGEA